MKERKKILIATSVGKLLNTREAATKLMRMVVNLPFDFVEFDFSNVEFISRSFADQFHKEKTKLANSKTISISNASEEVLNMLSTVANTQNIIHREYKKLPVFNFSDTSLLADYLLSV